MSKVDELKKKLEKQAEKNCVLNDRTHVDCFVSGYLKGSLPREKRIAELEKELAQAKEIIQQFLIQNPISDWLIEKAERFSKESEK